MATQIGVIFGGRSTEHRVSVVSARTVASALRQAGYDVVPMAIAQDGCWVPIEEGRRALDGAVDRVAGSGGSVRASLVHFLNAPVEAVFPIVHGTWGEDGTLQGLLEMADLPYVGTGVASSSVCMDKILAKRLLAQAGLAVVDYEMTTGHEMARDPDSVEERMARLAMPVFVKPSVGGSSVGVSKVTNRDELMPAIRHALLFDDRVLVEKGIEGRELECAVLGYGDWRASGVGEIIPGKDFYDYADKYIEDGAELIHSASLAPEVEAEIRRVAVRAMEAVAGWGMARVDFLLDPNGLYINEINTLPGFTAISMYPKLWQQAGMPLPRLVDELVVIARRRHEDRGRLDAGIKDWIRSLEAGSE